MSAVFVLILSMLSSSLASMIDLRNISSEMRPKCLNSSDCRYHLEQLVPVLFLNSTENAANRLREMASNLIYGNSSIPGFNATEQQMKLMNQTSGQYSSDEISIIKAFPNVSALETNASKVEPLNASEIDDNTKFSGRVLDINQLLSLFEPFNILGHRQQTTTTESYNAETNHGVKYPAVYPKPDPYEPNPEVPQYYSNNVEPQYPVLTSKPLPNEPYPEVPAYTPEKGPQYPALPSKPAPNQPYPELPVYNAEKGPNYETVALTPEVKPPKMTVEYN